MERAVLAGESTEPMRKPVSTEVEGLVDSAFKVWPLAVASVAGSA